MSSSPTGHHRPAGGIFRDVKVSKWVDNKRFEPCDFGLTDDIFVQKLNELRESRRGRCIEYEEIKKIERQLNDPENAGNRRGVTKHTDKLLRFKLISYNNV